MDFNPIRKKGSRFIIGLMSGTSCDGVDAALVRVKGTGAEMHIKLMDFKTLPYPPALRMRLLASRMDASEICALDSQVGRWMADAATQVLDAARKEMLSVDFIATSGHTIAHLPPPDVEYPGTLQIGEPAVIAQQCDLPVISEFRQRDMAAGGQGAPLVPYADWTLFHRDDRTIVCLNLGGIANVTVVPPDFDSVLAFDTGPANMAIDGAMRLLSSGNKHMDEGGALAASGVVVDEFLDYLLDHPYFGKVPPKSTGREEFGPEVYLRDALASRRDHSIEDLVATVTAAVAYSIVRAYNRFIKPQHEVSRVIVSGGGTHNKTLLRRIKQGIPDVVFRSSNDYGIPVDAREAVAFAILGNETICGTPSNVPSATGAKQRVVLGKITPG